MQSIGQLAVLGIAMTLVAALVLLPAIVQWMEDRRQAVPTQDAG
jgi:predicted RND superfamily exporter protein